ncbi:MAG: ABC transporter permease [Propionibacteriaceae bacterium]|nr:ABC transporter permease [Propionibacteriaceae bacterium]
MGKFIVRRLLQMIPVILGTTFLIFMMVYALPGDPTDGRCGQRPCPPQYVEAFRREYNLDKPVIVQYLLYLAKLLTGDFGTAYNGKTVLHELSIRYPVTIKLALIAIAIEAVIGIAAGILAAIRKGKFIDNLVTVSTLLLISFPVFVIGGLCQLVFGLQLGWFPVTATEGTWEQLVLPGIVLASLSVAYTARLTRTSLVENLRADYVRTARAKGLTVPRTIAVHALRNSLIPVVTYIGASFGALMGGAIVTERIFNINGIGGYIYKSIHDRDGTALVGTVLCLVVVYLVVNLLVDILYGVLDPRMSHD